MSNSKNNRRANNDTNNNPDPSERDSRWRAELDEAMAAAPTPLSPRAAALALGTYRGALNYIWDTVVRSWSIRVEMDPDLSFTQLQAEQGHYFTRRVASIAMEIAEERWPATTPPELRAAALALQTSAFSIGASINYPFTLSGPSNRTDRAIEAFASALQRMVKALDSATEAMKVVHQHG